MVLHLRFAGCEKLIGGTVLWFCDSDHRKEPQFSQNKRKCVLGVCVTARIVYVLNIPRVPLAPPPWTSMRSPFDSGCVRVRVCVHVCVCM